MDLKRWTGAAEEGLAAQREEMQPNAALCSLNRPGAVGSPPDGREGP